MDHRFKSSRCRLKLVERPSNDLYLRHLISFHSFLSAHHKREVTPAQLLAMKRGDFRVKSGYEDLRVKSKDGDFRVKSRDRELRMRSVCGDFRVKSRAELKVLTAF